MRSTVSAPDLGLVESLFAEIEKIPCINSHSHMGPEAERLAQQIDALAFFNHAYPAADLVAAGLSPENKEALFDARRPLDQRWCLFEPYWNRIRLTGYSQCILTGFRDLLGFDDLTAATVEPLSEAIQAHSKPGFYKTVLQQRANLARSVVNMEDLIEVDRTLFLPLPRLNRFSMLRTAEQIHAIERDYDVIIGNLRQHVAVIRQVCQDWKEARVAGVKMSQSYHRRMDFKERDAGQAAVIFDRLLQDDYAGLDSAEGALLEDYLVFECCQAAAEADLTVQFHLGMRAGNNGGMEGCSPVPLIPLLQAFPQVRFDLSHAGFPYLREGAVLGKTFANVYLNMSWIHIISPFGSRLDLREWLQMVPYNKIIAFGDDLQQVETVYGHLQMARRNFAYALGAPAGRGLAVRVDGSRRGPSDLSRQSGDGLRS